MSEIVNIESLSYGGAGVARLDDKADGKVLFIQQGVPGDRVSIKIEREKKSHAFGSIIEIVEPSPHRVEPECDAFGECGGCQWMNINYETQLEWKSQILKDTIKRIGGVDIADPVIHPATKRLAYRTRVRFHVKDGKWGFFAARSKSVVDIDSCPLLDPVINEAFLDIKSKLSNDLRGPLELQISLSQTDNKVTALFTLEKRGSVPRSSRINWPSLIERVELLKGIEVRRVSTVLVRAGETRIEYMVDGLTMSAEPGVFTQASYSANETLVSVVTDTASLRGTERVWDLFSGVGNLTLPLAKRGSYAAGIEDDRSAVWYARENAAANGIKNVRFSSGRASDKIVSDGAKFLASSTLDMIILDPPRGGDIEAVTALAPLGVERLIYISCAPPTLARDIKFLAESGYEVVGSSVIDIFPQTFHIESVTELIKSERS